MSMEERIAGVRADEIGRPVGAYRIELLDDRGRIRERVEKANYISTMHDAYVAWRNGRSLFDNALSGTIPVGNVGSTTTQTTSSRQLWIPPKLPVEFIIGTDSTIEEDPTSAWNTGRVVGWCSRWKASIPSSGRRGQVNETQSEVGALTIKQVFEFNENQANGTIGTIALGHIYPSPIPRLTATTGVEYGSVSMFGDAVGFIEVFNYDPANNKLFALRRNGTTTYAQEWDISSRTVSSDGLIDLSSATLTAEVLLASTSFSTTSSAGNWQTSSIGTIIRDGTDWIVCSTSASGRGWVRRYNSSGSLSWTYDNGNNGTSSNFGGSRCGMALVGGKIYACFGYTTSSFVVGCEGVKRINPSTGALEATLPFQNSIDGGAVYAKGGLCSNGTDLYVLTDEGIVKMSTAGTALAYLGDPVDGQVAEAGLAPWSTTSSAYRVANMGGVRGWPSTSGGQVGTAGVALALSYSGGKLYGTDGGTLVTIDGRNVFSRTVLDTPVTKTTSSTMKWTYELTLPESYAVDALGHESVPV